MILVDPPHIPRYDRWWSHVVSDTSFEELHAFAAELGIPARGFHRDHYDLPAEWYDAAIAAGAKPVTTRELVRAISAAGLRRRRTSMDPASG